MISITFRHVDSSDALKRYSEEKIQKLFRSLRQPMTAKVTLSLDRLKQMAEVRISSGGEHLEAKEATNDMYASIDVVLGKLERQIRSQHGAAKAKTPQPAGSGKKKSKGRRGRTQPSRHSRSGSRGRRAPCQERCQSREEGC